MMCYSNTPRQSTYRRKAAIGFGIYGGAAALGGMVGGPPGAIAGIVAVPEVLVVPILLTA
jgi:hypothetical protein